MLFLYILVFVRFWGVYWESRKLDRTPTFPWHSKKNTKIRVFFRVLTVLHPCGFVTFVWICCHFWWFDISYYWNRSYIIEIDSRSLKLIADSMISDDFWWFWSYIQGCTVDYNPPVQAWCNFRSNTSAPDTNTNPTLCAPLMRLPKM